MIRENIIHVAHDLCKNRVRVLFVQLAEHGAHVQGIGVVVHVNQLLLAHLEIQIV